MSNSNGKITAPVGVDTDIPQVLGISSMDVGTQQMSNAINKFSYYKPVNSPELGVLTMTDDLFKASLSPVYYYAVGDAPASADWKYTKYGGPFRVTDFDGYDHKEWIAYADVDGTLPSTINFDNCRYAIPTDYKRSFKLFVNYDYFNIYLMFVCTKGSIRKVYRNPATSYIKDNIFLFFGDELNVDEEAYQAFRAIDIGSYTVDVFAIALRTSDPSNNGKFTEITSGNFLLYPYQNVNGRIYNPLKKGIRITTPGARHKWVVSAHDLGNQTDGTYIPDDALIGASLMAIKSNGAGEDLYYDPNGRPFRDFENQGAPGEKGGTVASGNILVSGQYKYYEGALHIKWYEFRSGIVKPTIISIGSGGVIREDSSTRTTNIVYARSSISADAVKQITASFYFVDPDFRPQ